MNVYRVQRHDGHMTIHVEGCMYLRRARPELTHRWFWADGRTYEELIEHDWNHPCFRCDPALQGKEE